MQLDPYHIFLFSHLVFLIIGFGAVVVIDTCGLLWLLNKIKLSFVGKVAKITQPLIWIGWVGLVLSGAPLLYIKDSINGITILKIFFVVLVGINGIYLHFIKKTLDKINNNEKIPKILEFRIGFATLISQIGWWGSIIIGFLNNKLKDGVPKIEEPFTYITIILIILIVILLIGENSFRKKST
jgi:hypothetical protein